MTGVLVRSREETDTQGEHHVKMEGETAVDIYKLKNTAQCQELWEAGRASGNHTS
jgi:hypothetical protein